MCASVSVLQNSDSMSHWQAGGQAALCALHYCCDDWNQLRGGVAFQATHTHTYTLIHLLPLLPASSLSQIPVEQWSDEPSFSLALKRGVIKERERVEGRRKEREAGGKDRQYLYFWLRVTEQLLSSPAKGPCSLGPHTHSPAPPLQNLKHNLPKKSQ